MFGKNKVSPVAPRNPTQIHEDVRIKGTITVSEPLVIAGQLDGNVNADKLYAVLTAIITGEITSQGVMIDGRVLGGIVADKVFFIGNGAF
jgi:cytoskeletal protein CcmA (bactofilin family)